MNNIYLIATVAENDMESEHFLWSKLSENGWDVRNASDLPMLINMEIIVIRPELAAIAKKCLETQLKKVFLIVLCTTPSIILARATKQIRWMERNLASCDELCNEGACDLWFSGDDLESAAILIQRYIEKQEASF